MDRLETRTDPLNRVERYVYDLNGNLTRFTDRKNQITEYSYDPLQRRVFTQFADGAQVKSLYDLAGRLASIEDTLSGTIGFGYDSLDRLVSEITKQGKVEYRYDALGRRTTMVVNGGAPVEYDYDANSRLTQVSQGTQGVGLGYDDAGRRTSLAYPNGTNTSYTYDAASRLTRIFHDGPTSVIEDLTYTYDAAGNRVRIGRLGPEAPLPEAVQAAYDAANEQIRFNSGTPNLAYDANGNLISQTDQNGTTIYTWDARNRLVGIAGPGVAASFEYDALGRRVSKIINGVMTEYQYDGNDIISEIGGRAIGVAYVRGLNIDEPFVRQGSINEYYHIDSLGSTLRLSDARGAAATSYSYEAFGKTINSGTSSNSFKYTGREDDGTGIYFYRARSYSPMLKRFISEDPIGLLGADLNLYSYVKGNPLRYGDPLGLLIVEYAARIVYPLISSQTAEEAAIAGRIAEGFIAAILTGAGAEIPEYIRSSLGFTLEGVQALGGVQTFTLGLTIAQTSTGPIVFPLALSFAGGVEVGAAFNQIYERLRGQSLGEDIYDFIHRKKLYLLGGRK
jgi:RHS repeat-associated protein